MPSQRAWGALRRHSRESLRDKGGGGGGAGGSSKGHQRRPPEDTERVQPPRSPTVGAERAEGRARSRRKVGARARGQREDRGGPFTASGQCVSKGLGTNGEVGRAENTRGAWPYCREG